MKKFIVTYHSDRTNQDYTKTYTTTSEQLKIYIDRYTRFAQVKHVSTEEVAIAA